MSWLLKSSIGRKFLMALSGLCLVLFLLFHVSMNLVSIFSMKTYVQICDFLGTNWYALIGTGAIAALVLVHIIYAIWLTLQNQKARGKSKYAVTTSDDAAWSSKNMFVLGVVILAFLLVHLYDFWFQMMFSELFHLKDAVVPSAIGGHMEKVFGWLPKVIIYVIGIIALWLHLSHGVWSMFQTAGLNGKIWSPRLKCLGYVLATIVCLGFLVVPLFFYAKTLLV